MRETETYFAIQIIQLYNLFAGELRGQKYHFLKILCLDNSRANYNIKEADDQNIKFY